jgi:uncharacterized membrane protein YraQ (UPF0718 family)
VNNYCKHCGSKLEENASQCPECNAPVTLNNQYRPILKRKFNNTATLIFNLVNGVLLMLYITLWLTAIMQVWVSEDYLYFWIGNDQYFNYAIVLVMIVTNTVGFIMSGIDFQKNNINEGQRLLAIFFFINMFFMIYLAYEGWVWQA